MMARRILDKAGKLSAVEYTLAEVATLVGAEADEVKTWALCIAPTSKDDEGEPLYELRSPAQLKIWQKRAILLKTGMSEASVLAVEKAGRLDSYVALAEDCPEGITAHVWRSYAVVVMMQAKYSLKLTAEDLARRAGLVDRDENGEPVLGVETAKKHLRFLQALGYLQSIEVGDTIRVGGRNEKATYAHWLHRGLPKAWQGKD